MTEQYKTIEEVRKALEQKRNLLAEKKAELGKLQEQKSANETESKKEAFLKIIQNYLQLQEKYKIIMNQIEELEKAADSIAENGNDPELELDINPETPGGEEPVPTPSTEQKKNPAGLKDAELEKFLKLARKVSKGVKAEIKKAEQDGTDVFEAAKRELEKLDAPGNEENYYKYILRQARCAEKNEVSDEDEGVGKDENTTIKLEPEDLAGMTPKTQAMIELLDQENVEAGMNQVAEGQSSAPENLPVMPEVEEKDPVENKTEHSNNLFSKEIERLEKKLSKLTYSIPNRSGKIKLNPDGTFLDAGEFNEEGVWESDSRYGEQAIKNAKEQDYPKVKKLYDYDMQLFNMLKSQLAQNVVLLTEKLGGLKKLKESLNKYSFEEIGYTANLNYAPEIWIKHLIDFPEKIPSAEKIIKGELENLPIVPTEDTDLKKKSR